MFDINLVKRVLDYLGDDPNKIAETLEKEGITGVPGEKDDCPGLARTLGNLGDLRFSLFIHISTSV